MKTIILILILAVGFVYYRGTRAILEKQDLNCKWYAAYAICEGKAPTLPSFMDAIREGFKF